MNKMLKQPVFLKGHLFVEEWDNDNLTTFDTPKKINNKKYIRKHLKSDIDDFM